MDRLPLRIAVVFAMLAGVAALAVTLRAQPAAEAQDILPALLTEVRGLRAAMEQMASAGPRVELALGRLQLQEQRINTLIRRLESVRDRRMSTEREIELRQMQLKMAGPGGMPTNPEEREMAEQLQAMAKAETARLTAAIQQFTIEEADLAAEIASEQARWTSINQQLEELERSLGRR